MSTPELVDYYRRRAAEYEAIYAWPKRQADLDVLRKEIPARLAGRTVLEIACGTGYWTERIARTAKRVVATDLAPEPMAIARAKDYACPVELRSTDAYALDEALGAFDAAFAGFWWSHVPISRRGAFLHSLHARLQPGARVVIFDNRYVEGEMHPIVETDGDGNTYQRRRLADGGEHRVLKNFPSEEDLRRPLAGLASTVRYTPLRYYWLLDYRLP
ncbi:MAG TPA: methyltransferase domain-containing protein [Burkholderiales bacterium]|nr:methyltransferase domain-containing protein [Burkholderiales bacterium]